MTPTRKKRYRPQAPPAITRDRAHALIGKCICDTLLIDPARSHFPEQTIEWLISHLLEVIANDPSRP